MPYPERGIYHWEQKRPLPKDSTWHDLHTKEKWWPILWQWWLRLGLHTAWLGSAVAWASQGSAGLCYAPLALSHCFFFSEPHLGLTITVLHHQTTKASGWEELGLLNCPQYLLPKDYKARWPPSGPKAFLMKPHASAVMWVVSNIQNQCSSPWLCNHINAQDLQKTCKIYSFLYSLLFPSVFNIP